MNTNGRKLAHLLYGLMTETIKAAAAATATTMSVHALINASIKSAYRMLRHIEN